MAMQSSDKTMMRRGLFTIFTTGTVIAAGCFSAYDDYYVPLTDPALATSSSSSSGGGGGDAGVDCSGNPSVANTLEECAVFVQADATGAIEDGTRSRPYKTLQKAIDNAQGRRVFACTSGAFAESVTLNASLEVWGGFDCSQEWSWSQDARSTLNGLADTITLTLMSGADGALITGFAINAAHATMKGGSSIAIAVADIDASIVRCEVSAGNGMAGDDGVTPSTPPDKGADAPPPDPLTMNACILPASINGGAPGTTTCDGVNTSGGIGGKGGVTGMNNGDGEKGADGLPADAANGLGGAGAAAMNCKDGGKGLDGDPGVEGPGGSGMSDALSISGITNSEMTDGTNGKPGQGGGGGGGAKSGVFCPPAGMPVDGPGASGGGGGAGGCGGKGGGGGKAGGSSIAILSLGNKLVLTDVSIALGSGGKGGSGAIGQGGGGVGAGAFGGTASGIGTSKAGCKGGDGGAGGNGGPGGGGRGGHAIGVAFGKPPSAAPTIKTFTPGTVGAGGAQGPTGPVSSMGVMGRSGVCWDFTANVACP